MTATLIEILSHLPRALDEDLEHLARVVEASGRLHVGDGVALDLGVGGLLLENADELEVGRVGANAVDDGEGEFALGQVFAHALVVAVFLGREVHIVVADLKDEADEVDEGHAVDAGLGLCLHELDAQTEEATGLVAHHLEVVLLGGAGEGVSPEEIHALAAVEVDELF